jgi:hypothetical protein
MRNRRTVISLLVLLAALAAPMAMRLWVTVDFWLNRDAYSAYFCVNKEVKELDCKGRCHLARTLETEKEVPSLPSFPVETFLSEALPSGECEVPEGTTPLLRHYLPFVSPLHPTAFYTDIERPPQVGMA